MRIGLGLPWGAQSSAGEFVPPPPPPPADFTPSDLFAGGEAGAWYDIQEPSAMTISRDGTSGAPSIGSVVGRLIDQSGNANHLEAYADAARPLLQQDLEGRFYLQFDGVDDTLRLDFPIGAQFTAIFAANGPTSASGSRTISFAGDLGSDSSTNGYARLQHSSGTNQFRTQYSTTPYNFGAGGAPLIYEIEYDNGIITGRSISGDGSVSYTLAATRIALGGAAETSPRAYAAMDLFGLVMIDRILTASERGDVYQYLAERSGATAL